MNDIGAGMDASVRYGNSWFNLFYKDLRMTLKVNLQRSVLAQVTIANSLNVIVFNDNKIFYESLVKAQDDIYNIVSKALTAMCIPKAKRMEVMITINELLLHLSDELYWIQHPSLVLI